MTHKNTNMASVIIRVRAFLKEYPLAKGMLTYFVLWPTSNLCQQAIQRRKQYDFREAARFTIFGTFVVAPSLYLWVKVAGKLVPGTSIKTAITKVASYDLNTIKY